MDGLEQQLRGQVRFVRLNARDSIGAETMRRYDVLVVPTFLVIGADGKERLRSVGRVPRRGDVLTALGLHGG